MSYEKRFPADTTLEKLTFLNNKKIDAELYAYFQGISNFDAIQNGTNMDSKEKLQHCKTYVLKKKLPTQKIIADKIGITEKTLRAHIKELINYGFLIKEEDNKDIAYYLPMCEDMYFLIPLETIQYFNDTLKQEVVKVYIYLGVRWQQVEYERSQGRQRDNYSFTYKELGDHLGISIENNERNLKTIRNMVDCLTRIGLIDYVDYFDGKTKRKRLTKFITNINSRVEKEIL